MKTTVRGLIVTLLAAASSMVMLAGNAQGADKEIISVAISPTVQDQVQKSSPDERKKMERAIRVGNKFIPHHFDLTAYARNDEQEEKIWLKNIRPLVNRGSTDWYNPGGVFSDGAPELEINGNKVSFEVVCPQSELISANEVNDHFELKYRTKIIGMWKSNSIERPIQGDILLDDKEEFDEVHIALDKNNRVSHVASKYAVLPTIPKQGIHFFEAEIKWLRWGLTHSNFNADEKNRSETKIVEYQQFIELIKNEESAVCNGMSANSNLISGRK